MTGPVIFHQSECCIRGRTRMMKKKVVSFQTLIISSTPQVNLSPTRPKSSRGQRKAHPAAQVTRACSQARLKSISLLSPPTCALACSSNSLSYSRVSPAACSFNAAKSFLVLSSSAGMKTKPEKVNCDLFTHVSWASGSFLFLIFELWLARYDISLLLGCCNYLDFRFMVL